jgi:hypothetical protein
LDSRNSAPHVILACHLEQISRKIIAIVNFKSGWEGPAENHGRGHYQAISMRDRA